MGSGKGGGSAKGGGGKGGGQIEAMPSGGRGGMMGGNGSSAAATGQPAAEPYNAQRDFYGDGNMVNQPLPGYFKTFPAPGGNNYAPPPVEEVVKEVVKENPFAGMVPSTGAANNSPEVRQAFSAGANNQASANELAAFNLGVPDTNNDGRLSDEEFTSWDGYGAYSQKNGSGILLSGGPGGSDGSRFTGQYGQDGNPVYTSGFMAAPQGNRQGQGTYNPAFLRSGNGQRGGGAYNPAFLPNSSPFAGSLIDPNIRYF